MNAYPLVFEPILKEKVWGGRRLAALGKMLPDGAKVGESWEVADLGATSIEGGGGDAEHSRIVNGSMRGMTLDEAIRAMGPNLMGLARLSGDGGFPLLVKYLDARENLSVQVHPSPAYAAAHPGAHLKTESWYVVAAEPVQGKPPMIYKGVKRGVTREAFAAHIADNTVVDDLIAVPAVPGDFHHLPSGTCHALGAGVLVAEVQTPSDTTFRVYDWGRTNRKLHIEQALECIDFSGATLPVSRSDGKERTVLARNEFYGVDEIRAARGRAVTIEMTDAPVVWMCLRGSGRIESGIGAFMPSRFGAGTTMLIPAACRHAMPRAVFDEEGAALEVRVG